MTALLKAATSELYLAIVEVENLKMIVGDPFMEFHHRLAAGLRLEVMEMAQKRFENIMIRELVTANIEDILPMGKMVHALKSDK